MRALVFVDRNSTCLAPLDREYALATLPLAGKPLIFYTIEDLVGAGFRDIVFVVADHADRIERLLGDGKRWGAQFRFVLGRGDERPSALWLRLRIGSDQPLLALRGDLVRSPAVAALMQAAQTTVGPELVGLPEDPRGALILLRPGPQDPAALLDILAFEQPSPVAESGCVRLPEVAVRPLDSLQAYHRACLDLVAGNLQGLLPGGRESALGLNVGLRAQVSPRSLKQGRAYVGDQSRVHPEAELLGTVMIARDAVVDRAVLLSDCVILPQSYIGEMLEVQNAIVAGDTLIRVDTGVVLTITDAFLLGRLRSGLVTGGDVSPLLDRGVGLLLLLLSAPLWLLGLMAAALQADRAEPSASGRAKRERLFVAELLLGNRADAMVSGIEKAFISHRLATRIPVLSYLPRLWGVIRGDLRLFGVSPLSPGEAQSRSEDWQRVRDQAPVGLLGPTQLLLSADDALDERLMSDAFYVGQRGWRRHLQLLGDALRLFVSPRAWRMGTPS